MVGGAVLENTAELMEGSKKQQQKLEEVKRINIEAES